MKKVLCEISGGYDSALATLYAQEMFPDAQFYGIFINYNQLPYTKEIELAKKFCRTYNIILEEIQISNLFSSGTCQGGDSAETLTDVYSSIYTPLRNLVILSCASSYAETIGASTIVVGSKGLNYDGQPYSFKDSLHPFYVLFNSVLDYLTDKKIEIVAPLMHRRQIKMKKDQVYKELIDRGHSLSEFWNCFNSAEKDCGVCNNCKEKYAFIQEMS